MAQQAGIPAGEGLRGSTSRAEGGDHAAAAGRGRAGGVCRDGINDAPALKQADLGIAVSRASDVAREAADVILLRSDIEAIPEAMGLAQATLRTIRQNLFWAFSTMPRRCRWRRWDF